MNGTQRLLLLAILATLGALLAVSMASGEVTLVLIDGDPDLIAAQLAPASLVATIDQRGVLAQADDASIDSLSRQFTVSDNLFQPDASTIAVHVTLSSPPVGTTLDEVADEFLVDLERFGGRERWRAKYTSSFQADVPLTSFDLVSASRNVVHMVPVRTGGSVSLSQSVPHIMGSIPPSYWPWPDQYVVVMDTGVTYTGPLANNVLHDFGACFSQPMLPGFESVCPNPDPVTMVDRNYGISGPGDTFGAPCDDDLLPATLAACAHGTQIAASMIQDGAGSYDGIVTNGGLKIIPISIFSRTPGGALDTNSADVEIALNYVITLKQQIGLDIAAVNMSLNISNSFPTTTPCDGDTAYMYLVNEMSTLRDTYKVAPVAAAGNVFADNKMDGLSAFYYNHLDPPACLMDVISVGATNDGATKTVAKNAPLNGFYFSTKSHEELDFWAPGSRITSWTWPNGSNTIQGSSFSAAFFSATFARMRARYPTQDVDWILGQFETHCDSVSDPRPNPNVIRKHVCYKSMWQ